MAQKKHSKPDPSLQTERRTDVVDQSKGIFPPGVPHPKDAESLPPGKLGGGPYEESGRGGVAGEGRSPDQPNPAVESASAGETAGEVREDDRDAEDQEPRGVLPP